MGRGVGGHGDHGGRQEVDDQEAAAVHPHVDVGLEVDPGQEEQQRADTGGIEDVGGAGPGPGAQARRSPDEHERRPDEEPRRPGVGAEVGPRRVDRVGEDPHEDRGRQRGREHQEEQLGATHHRQRAGHDQRPHQVELLLDREGPEVGQGRGPAHLLEVRRAADDQVPVGDVGQRREDLRLQVAELAAVEQGDEGDGDREQQPQGGEQASTATDPEVPEVDPSLAGLLADEQRRDQVAADHEEDLDAEEATLHPTEAGVVGDDREDGDRPDAVDAGQVAETRTPGGGGRCIDTGARPPRTSAVGVRQCRSWRRLDHGDGATLPVLPRRSKAPGARSAPPRGR